MSDVRVENALQKRQLTNAYENASRFYEEKLEKNPTMGRYKHYLAAMSSAQGKVAEADSYYRQTLESSPGDVLVKNDFAVHLLNNYTDRKEDAVKELKKALILVNDSAIIHKNTAAAYARKGDFQQALVHAQQAKHLAPNDCQNHRNIAKLESILGDNHTSLKHNLFSIEAEENKHQSNPSFVPNTSAYRAAAVQIISKGGDHQEALDLMNKARVYEQKKFVLSTSQRTHEIIRKLQARQMEEFQKVQAQKRAEEEKKKKATEEWEKMLSDMTR